MKKVLTKKQIHTYSPPLEQDLPGHAHSMSLGEVPNPGRCLCSVTPRHQNSLFPLSLAALVKLVGLMPRDISYYFFLITKNIQLGEEIISSHAFSVAPVSCWLCAGDGALILLWKFRPGGEPHSDRAS